MGLLSTIGAASARAYGFTRSAIAAAVDAYFNRVTLLLPGNGTNGAQNNTFLDSSTNTFSITRNGNTTQGTFSPFSQTGWSNFFGATTAYAGVSNTALALGSGDFEILLYSYREVNSPYLVGSGNTTGSWAITGTSATTIAFRIDTLGSNLITGTAPINQWNKIHVIRTSGTISLYVNDVLQSSVANTTNFTTSNIGIGSYTQANNFAAAGYISNFKLVKAGTTILDTCRDNRFKDNSSNNFTITPAGSASVQAFSPFAPSAAYSAATVGGSGYFDGTGDFLSIPDSTSLTIGTNNFTVEAWVYAPSTAANFAQLCGQRDSAGSANANSPFGIFKNNTGPELSFSYWNGSSNVTGTGTIPVFNNAWHHVALVRNGTDLRLYVDGVSSVAVTLTGGFSFSDSNTIFAIGRAGAFDGQYWTGYINGFRFVNGTAVYTSAFTPPTAPPTAITNTTLLLNFTNGGIIDATGKNVLETVGNAQISTTQSKFGGSSMYFDGTGDYLSTAAVSQNLVLGTGDFTVEGWAYHSSRSAVRGIFQISTTANGLVANPAAGLSVLVNTNGTVGVYAAGNVSGYNTSTTTVALDTWFYFTLVRASGVTKLYINGNLVTDIFTSGSLTDTFNYTGAYIAVGGSYNTSNLWLGYIDDFRVSKGIARYTANFTPPTAAFPLQ